MTKNDFLCLIRYERKTKKQYIWAVFEICLVYELVYGFFWYADSIHIYWNLQSEWYMFWYKTRNDRFWLVYNWYMASWYTYNDLFFAVMLVNVVNNPKMSNRFYGNGSELCDLVAYVEGSFNWKMALLHFSALLSSFCCKVHSTCTKNMYAWEVHFCPNVGHFHANFHFVNDMLDMLLCVGPLTKSLIPDISN